MERRNHFGVGFMEGDSRKSGIQRNVYNLCMKKEVFSVFALFNDVSAGR